MGKGAETRERILEEAMKIASRDGLSGLTIGGLAKALSLSKSGLFMHFGSKERLQIAVLDHTWKRFQEFVWPRTEGIESGVDRMRAFFLGWLDWIDNPDLPGGCPVLAASFELDDREGPSRDHLVERQRLSHRNLALAFEAIAGPEGDPEQMVFELRAITLGYHYMSRVLRDPKARDQAVRAFNTMLERSVRQA